MKGVGKSMGSLQYSDRFWTKWYRMLGMPEELPEPPVSIIEQIYNVWAERVPRDHIAMVCGGYEMTAKEMLDTTLRIISALRAMGVEKGEKVATLIGNGIQLATFMFALQLGGFTWQPISALQKEPEIARQLRESDAKVIICYERLLPMVESVKAESALEHIIVTDERDYTAVQDASVSDPPGAVQLRSLLARHEPGQPDFNRTKDDDAVLIFTGGATGVPKGVQLTLGNINYFEALLGSVLGPLEDVLVGNIAMVVAQHMFHIGIVIWLLGMRLGCTLYLVHDPRDARTIYNYLTKPGVFFALYAPGQIARMAEIEDLDMTKIGHVLSLSGMAALSPELGEKYRKKTGTSPFQAYGQTESTALITLNIPAMLSTLGFGNAFRSPRMRKVLSSTMPALHASSFKMLALFVKLVGPERLFMSDQHRLFSFLNKRGGRKRTGEMIRQDIKSIGIPSWNTDIKLVDMEDRTTIMPVGEVGELCFKGPQRMKGYLPTEEGYDGPGYDSDGFVHTGDAAYMDEDGLLYLVDRTKDMINVSGFKVYGTTVEDAVYEHPAIAMCAAYAVPDKKDETNERVKLAIQLKSGFESSEQIEKEILALCEQKLAPYAKPRFIEFMDELPMLHTEKVDKKYLRERELEMRKQESMV